jgi:hypothetical protein
MRHELISPFFFEGLWYSCCKLWPEIFVGINVIKLFFHLLLMVAQNRVENLLSSGSFSKVDLTFTGAISHLG